MRVAVGERAAMLGEVCEGSGGGGEYRCIGDPSRAIRGWVGWTKGG